MNSNKPVQVNAPFLGTIHRDPNLSNHAKHLFVLLCEKNLNSRELVDSMGQLLQHNYIYMDGFPSNVPGPGKNRTSWQLRRAALKQFFTGRPE